MCDVRCIKRVYKSNERLGKIIRKTLEDHHLEDYHFIFQRHNGYIGLNTRHKLLMWCFHMMDVIWEF